MGKSQVPGGVTKKEKCGKCGKLYFPSLMGNSLRTTSCCIVCDPGQYEKPKEKEINIEIKR